MPSQATINMPMRLVMVSARAVSLVIVVVSWWRMPDGCGFGPGSIICPPCPPPWPNTSGEGDSKYVSGLLKHIHYQNEETVNAFPSDENSIRPANIVEMTTLWEMWLSTQNAQIAQLLLDLGCFGPNLLDMGSERSKRVGYGMWGATISEMWNVGGILRSKWFILSW